MAVPALGENLSGPVDQRRRLGFGLAVVLAPGRGRDVEVVVARQLDPTLRGRAIRRRCGTGLNPRLSVCVERRTLGDAVVAEILQIAAAVSAAGRLLVDQQMRREVLLDEVGWSLEDRTCELVDVGDLFAARGERLA